MDGAKGSALEWALALLRAPGERHVLRQKALPADVGRLLGIAAGATPEALADAARAFGEPEARVQEAARFYAREVLFFPQADAYRVLGVDRDASAGQIKAHHRLLQHWLHPDRLQSEDDAVFATRVNSAWNRLRNAERREAYDQALRQDRPPEVFDSNGVHRSAHAWVPDVEAPDDRWRHRLPMLVLTLACLVLVLLVVRDMRNKPEKWPEGRQTIAEMAEESLGISMPRREPETVAAKSRKADAPRAMPSTIQDRRARMASPVQRPFVPAVVAPPAPTTNTPAPIARNEIDEAPQAKDQMQSAREPAPQRAVPQETNAQQPTFARIQSARQAGDEFLRYMGAINRPPPPIWNSPAIQSSADQLRQELHGGGRVRLAGPQWRIGEETAVLTSGYTVQGVDAGVLTMDMAWREGHWLVTGLSMERAR